MVYAKNSVPIEAIPNESSDSARQRLYENSPSLRFRIVTGYVLHLFPLLSGTVEL